jgi:hypothetical protein
VTAKANTFETGLAGTTITSANSDDGTAGDIFDSGTVSGPPASGTMQYSNDLTVVSGLSAKIATGATSGTCMFGWNLTTTTVLYMRAYYSWTGNPSANRRIMQVFDTSTTRASISRQTDGLIRLLNSSGGTVFTTGAAPTSPFRLEVFFDLTNGQASMRTYEGSNKHGSTPDQTLGPTACTFGTAQITNGRWGLTIAAANAETFYIDDVAMNDTGWIGPSVSTDITRTVEGVTQSGVLVDA